MIVFLVLKSVWMRPNQNSNSAQCALYLINQWKIIFQGTDSICLKAFQNTQHKLIHFKRIAQSLQIHWFNHWSKKLAIQMCENCGHSQNQN